MKIYHLLDLIDRNDMDMDDDIKFMEKFDPKAPEMTDIVPVIQFNTVLPIKEL